MSVLGGAHHKHAPDDDDVAEELTAACTSSKGGSVGSGPLADGLQQFVSNSNGGGSEGRRVVQVKATTSRKDAGGGVAVSAAGVGWGLSKQGSATAFTPSEAKKLAAEVQKKKQIWKVRKTFGLDPTPLSDNTAQVEESGAGAWT